MKTPYLFVFSLLLLCSCGGLSKEEEQALMQVMQTNIDLMENNRLLLETNMKSQAMDGSIRMEQAMDNLREIQYVANSRSAPFHQLKDSIEALRGRIFKQPTAPILQWTPEHIAGSESLNGLWKELLLKKAHLALVRELNYRTEVIVCGVPKLQSEVLKPVIVNKAKGEAFLLLNPSFWRYPNQVRLDITKFTGPDGTGVERDSVNDLRYCYKIRFPVKGPGTYQLQYSIRTFFSHSDIDPELDTFSSVFELE